MIPKYDTNKKEVMSFRKNIPANTSIVLQERVKAPGTVEGLRIKFYTGVQLAMTVRPLIEHKGKRNEDLITYAEGTSQFISGENDYFVYDVVASVDYDDYIKIYVTNTDLTYAYDLSVDVVVDYFGGMNRVV